MPTAMVHRRFAFVFPMASGHINPSLPIARALVKQGHEVHYQCREQMREAIEDTGSVFHDEIVNLPEMYVGREPDVMGAMGSVATEFGLQDDSMVAKMVKLKPVLVEFMAPGTIRFLQKLQPDVVVCCPLANRDGVFAARYLGIPCVSLLTTAGPGSMRKALLAFLDAGGVTLDEMIVEATGFIPGKECQDRMENKYGIRTPTFDMLQPPGVLQSILDSTLVLVTTSADLQDETTPEMDAAYACVRFEAVGPLLDQEGAVRAAGHKMQHTPMVDAPSEAAQYASADPLLEVRKARASGRKVIFVSMGTIITGDSPDLGWDAKPRSGKSGERRGLTGRQLCQSAWAGAFDAFGSYGDGVDKAPLLLVALGPQDNALDGLMPPDNAICLPMMPQVDILKAGVDLFLTHGGQNSFTESLSEGVPVVVCPGFGDQSVNARKALKLGVGLQVERPVPANGNEEQAMEAYRTAVRVALLQVSSDPCFTAMAQACAERLRAAGGVARAVNLIHEIADNGTKRTSLPTLLRKPCGDSQSLKTGNNSLHPQTDSASTVV